MRSPAVEAAVSELLLTLLPFPVQQASDFKWG